MKKAHAVLVGACSRVHPAGAAFVPALLTALALALPASAQTTVRVSIASDGSQALRESRLPTISADGQFVVFESFAANLVIGDLNSRDDVFLHDLVTQDTVLISVDSSGNQQGPDPGGASATGGPTVSADGGFVAFASRATDLVPNDTNNAYDIFLRDVLSGTTNRISVGAGGAQHFGDHSLEPSISDDGCRVAFQGGCTLLSGCNNGQDIYVRDCATPSTLRVSVDDNGVAGNDVSRAPSMSGDGRFVAFLSLSSSLVANDTNAVADIFVRDTLAAITTRANVSSAGTEANHDSLSPSVSGDGELVAFSSRASNLVQGDTKELSRNKWHIR